MHRVLSLLLLILFLLPAALPAEEEIVATILIHGLRHVDRELLLNELELHEGDRCPPDLEARLQRRGRRLPYLLSFHAEATLHADGVHVLIRVRERKQFHLYPQIRLLDDGDLIGGFHLESYSPLGRGETWDLDLMTGAATDLGLAFRGLRLPGPHMPRLFAEGRFRDWDDPFLASEVRRWSLLAGLEFPLPRGGTLLAGGGRERVDSNPPAGLDPLGEDSHGLFRGRFRQPLFGGLALRGRITLRTPEKRRGYGWGQLGAEHHQHAGRWDFAALGQAGAVSSNSPLLGGVFLSSWRWLHAYEAGTLQAGNWQFFRLRADLHLIEVPLRFSRRGDEQLSPLSAFILAEHARYRSTYSEPFLDVGNLGVGLCLRPPRSRQMLSAGAFLDREGEMTFLFMMETSR